MLGNIGVCPDLVLKGVIGKLVPVIGSVSDQCPCVVLHPAPRYVKGGCCADNTHSTTTGNPNYKGDILEQTAHIRKVLRDEMVGSKLLGVWVSDVIFGLAGGSHGQDSESTARNISELYIADNVHLSTLGYRRLAVCIIEGVQHAKNKMISAECIVSGEKRSYFESIRGSFRQNFSSTNYKLRGGRSGQPGQRGGRGSGHHPYRGNSGKSGR